MPYELADRLVVGVASSALFDLAESDAVFRAQGEEAYRLHQEAHIDDTLKPGVAFPFLQRLLALNDLRPDDALVEVIVLSKNDPSTGLRVMRSIATHGLAITRSVFTQGKAPYDYIPALDMSLFLSGDPADVRAAVDLDLPAGQVLSSSAATEDDGHELRIAFDFDGVLAADDSERIYQGGGIEKFREYEQQHQAIPLNPGPLSGFLRDVNRIQAVESQVRDADPTYQPRLRVSIVTARNAPAHERAVRTLQQWGVTVNDAFFLGGIDKGRILEVMRPHIFFDDQEAHLLSTAAFAPSVHVPYGVTNQASDVS
ncbi:5'-nucleotidase [Krasilnikoviella flava]|uniref:5'-nucleotidase n=1 Tax=Krasilnikoviella flava TaxID=526729 RepID=A0A1T5JKN4_9MICO|nr:5'-nucleotidase [Krasilnikoviella flava]SKC51792.1 5'-nucleotidase [Krasilnikoviella flava]